MSRHRANNNKSPVHPFTQRLRDPLLWVNLFHFLIHLNGLLPNGGIDLS